MSSESVDLLWDESIKELRQLVNEEKSIDESKRITINDAFRHFAKLYIRYTIVLSNLNKCYELSVQPQKRLDVKSTLVNVICRVINLRHLLVKWSPPNPDVLCKDGPQKHFSWEYADLSQALRELKVSPSHFGTDTPSVFKEESVRHCCARNNLVLRLLRYRYGDELPLLEEKDWAVQPASASDPIEEEATECDADCDDKEIVSIENNPDLSAIKIQSTTRTHLCKKKVTKERHWVGAFVGMKSEENDRDRVKLAKNLEVIRHRRKQEQTYCQEKYNHDLTRLKDVVKDEEGFRMKNDLKEERIKWITDQVVSKNAIPDSFEGFYVKDEPPPDDKDTGGKDMKKDSKKKNGDDKKSKEKAAPIEVELPSMAGPSVLLDSLVENINTYESRWQQRNIGPDRIRSQRHDEELAKSLIIRDQVKSELTTGVEEKLLSNLQKIKAMSVADAKKSKKKDVAKGKKGKGKKAGGKGKKEKPLPGAKLPEMKDMKVEQMLQELIESGLVCIPAQHTLNDLIGGFESQSPKISVGKGDNERWVPRDPSTFQLKRAIYDYCILTLGSQEIKAKLPDEEHVRSLLFYGPEGSGKTLMVHAIASEIGALFINLSSSAVGNSFGGKEGATKLIHMAFTVAKEKSYGPVVIYLDDCHEFFMGKSKKGGSDAKANMQRFQKDLLVYKNQALQNDDRVLVLGCTNRPELADVKLMRWKGPSGKPEKQGFFERSLYFPRANHSDRSMLWRQCIQKKLSTHQTMPRLDYDALALLSDGYSAGEITYIVESVLTVDRLKTLSSDPPTERDFTCYLSDQRKPNDFLNFTRQITELDTRWKALKAPQKAADSKKK